MDQRANIQKNAMDLPHTMLIVKITSTLTLNFLFSCEDYICFSAQFFVLNQY